MFLKRSFKRTLQLFIASFFSIKSFSVLAAEVVDYKIKLATLDNGTRDGQLVIVNRNLTKAVAVPEIAMTMQNAIDQWEGISPKLADIFEKLNSGEKFVNIIDFTVAKILAPLPRAYQWLDGSAYLSHMELVRKARGSEMPPSFWTDPLMYQGLSDKFLGAKDDIVINDEAWGIDFESEIAIITDDVPMGCSVSDAEKHIILFLLVNDVSLRNLIPAELEKGFGFIQSKPASSFSPVAITPLELGKNWKDGKVCLPLISKLNGHEFGCPNAGIGMAFNFSQLIAHAAKTRSLSAGTIIGSGTVSNKDEKVGFSCIVEKRMSEIIKEGKPRTAYMQFGDHIQIEMLDHKNNSIFGSIDQYIKRS